MTKSIEQDVSHTSERPKNAESTGKAATAEREKTFVRNRSNCYLRHMGLPGPCPGTGGVEAWFCEHPKCLCDDYY